MTLETVDCKCHSPNNISPKIQPNDHMSTPLVYLKGKDWNMSSQHKSPKICNTITLFSLSFASYNPNAKRKFSQCKSIWRLHFCFVSQCSITTWGVKTFGLLEIVIQSCNKSYVYAGVGTFMPHWKDLYKFDQIIWTNLSLYNEQCFQRVFKVTL